MRGREGAREMRERGVMGGGGQEEGREAGREGRIEGGRREGL